MCDGEDGEDEEDAHRECKVLKRETGCWGHENLLEVVLGGRNRFERGQRELQDVSSTIWYLALSVYSPQCIYRGRQPPHGPSEEHFPAKSWIHSIIFLDADGLQPHVLPRRKVLRFLSWLS